MNTLLFTGGTLVLPDRLLADGWLLMSGDRIIALGPPNTPPRADQTIDLAGAFLAPGFVDVHVHGGDGHDFMDGTEEAFRAICKAHARHGTTSLLPTTTVARHDQHLAFLAQCRRLKREGTGGARILGAHFYGPYFAAEAKGCHPGEPVRPPRPDEYAEYLAFAACICRATVAPEL